MARSMQATSTHLRNRQHKPELRAVVVMKDRTKIRFFERVAQLSHADTHLQGVAYMPQ